MTDQTERENGYYWVKLYASGPYIIAEYWFGEWTICGEMEARAAVHRVLSDRLEEPVL